MPYPSFEPGLPWFPLLSHTSTVITRRLVLFYSILALCVGLIFIANIDHQTQQGIYHDYHSPLATNLLQHNGYVMNPADAEPAFYPLWGYPLLVAAGMWTGHPFLFLMGLQYALCIIGILVMYRLFGIKEKFWHLPFFVPFAALLSVKWPDAIIAPILLFYAWFTLRGLRRESLFFSILGGIMLGVICNFRPEYLLLPLLQLFLVFFPRLHGKRKEYLVQTCMVFSLSLLSLLPWALRSYGYDGMLRLTSTNGGAVLYITLGQLPDNPWEIVPLDQSAVDYVETKGVLNPYSIHGDQLLKERWFELVRESPSLYAQKVLRNYTRALSSGLYIGEYGILQEGRSEEIQQFLDQGIFHAWSHLDLEEKGFLFGKLLFRGIFLLALCLTFFWIIRRKDRPYLALVLTALLAHKFLTVSLIQYEPRHMNAICPLVFGGAIHGLVYVVKPFYLRVRNRIESWRRAGIVDGSA